MHLKVITAANHDRQSMKNVFDSLESIRTVILSFTLFIADESDNGVGLCGWLLTTISWGLVMVTLPFSLCVCFKVGISHYNMIRKISIGSLFFRL